jgi:hypothetical protein
MVSGYGQNRAQLCLTTPVANAIGESATVVIAAPTHCAAINTIDLFSAEYAMLTLVVTGANAGATGNITARFKIRGDPTQAWPNNTETTYDLTGALTGVTEARYTKLIDTRGLMELKLYSVQNADATYHATVNVEITYKW